jgi:RNA polymerase sigma-70 factor (ECF subfamily)
VELEEELASPREQTGGAEVERDEEYARLRFHLAALPARQREVLDLRVNHELSHAEIAALLGISEEASRANAYQGLKRLREAFASELESNQRP